MKRLFYISACCLLFSLINISWLPKSAANAEIVPLMSINDSIDKTGDPEEAASIYNDLGLEELGLSKKAFEYAYRGYQHLLEKKRIKEPGYLTICDFSQSSNNKRLYLIDLSNNEIVLNTYVAHGCNSGAEFATRFSNRPSSHQSSLGFYITQNTYTGEHGLSLKIAGVEPGFNDKAMRRCIVVHGASYVEEKWLENNNYMGRSYGCPAVPREERDLLINTIKDGTCLFIYYPSNYYLKNSRILND